MNVFDADGYSLMVSHGYVDDVFVHAGHWTALLFGHFSVSNSVKYTDYSVVSPNFSAFAGHGPLRIRGTGSVAVAHTPGRFDTPNSVQRCDVITTEKPWGYEKSPQTPHEQHLLKLLFVGHAARTSEQLHHLKDEVMYVLSPGGTLQFDASEAPMLPGTFIHIPPKRVHRVTGPVQYLEASTFHPTDVVRLSDDYER